LVFDLRFDPSEFASLTPQQLAEAWQRRWDEPGLRLPVKTLAFNRCPAIAPLGVLDEASQKRLKLSLKTIDKNHKKLKELHLANPVLEALALMEKSRQAQFIIDEHDVDSRLYDGFFDESDRGAMRKIRSANIDSLAHAEPNFHDERLNALLPLYKARNFPKSLTHEERLLWERFRHRRLLGGKQQSKLAKYFARLGELAEQRGLSKEKHYLLEELQLYGQSVMPEPEDEDNDAAQG
jgi:exodeoxyribonuclease I